MTNRTDRALSAVIGAVSAPIIARRLSDSSLRDAFEEPLKRAWRLTDFAEQATSNAKFRGDCLDLEGLCGVFESLRHELEDLTEIARAYFDHLHDTKNDGLEDAA
jgi:hypothetical protein